MEFDKRLRRIVLSESNGVPDPELNEIIIDDKVYLLDYIKEGYKVTKGGNSTVFRLVDPTKEETDKAIKFSNISKPNRRSHEFQKKRFGRFMTEIEALTQIKDSYTNPNVVTIINDGVWSNDYGDEFPYYVMEIADDDLTNYILSHNSDLDAAERIKLCIDIFHGISTLHDLNYYHRDIKPDNVLVFYDSSSSEKFTWKVSDLGLIAHRDKDNDDLSEKIGPIGWLSPEAMNKYLTESFNIGNDCRIDNQSDIFQLGKLFWFIFNCNVPIGQITLEDFKFQIDYQKFIFELIFKMLYHSKQRRISMNELKEDLYLIGKEFYVI